MPKLEDVLKIKVDQPTQAQRLDSFGRRPRKAPKPIVSEPAQEPAHGG